MSLCRSTGTSSSLATSTFNSCTLISSLTYNKWQIFETNVWSQHSARLIRVNVWKISLLFTNTNPNTSKVKTISKTKSWRGIKPVTTSVHSQHTHHCVKWHCCGTNHRKLYLSVENLHAPCINLWMFIHIPEKKCRHQTYEEQISRHRIWITSIEQASVYGYMNEWMKTAECP